MHVRSTCLLNVTVLGTIHCWLYQLPISVIVSLISINVSTGPVVLPFGAKILASFLILLPMPGSSPLVALSTRPKGYRGQYNEAIHTVHQTDAQHRQTQHIIMVGSGLGLNRSL